MIIDSIFLRTIVKPCFAGNIYINNYNLRPYLLTTPKQSTRSKPTSDNNNRLRSHQSAYALEEDIKTTSFLPNRVKWMLRSEQCTLLREPNVSTVTSWHCCYCYCYYCCCNCYRTRWRFGRWWILSNEHYNAHVAPAPQHSTPGSIPTGVEGACAARTRKRTYTGQGRTKIQRIRKSFVGQGSEMGVLRAQVCWRAALQGLRVD